jgi:hypothetical protein
MRGFLLEMRIQQFQAHDVRERVWVLFTVLGREQNLRHLRHTEEPWAHGLQINYISENRTGNKDDMGLASCLWMEIIKSKESVAAL